MMDGPRMAVPMLNDAEPLDQQLLYYFLIRDLWQRKGEEMMPAPLELMTPGEVAPGSRPMNEEEQQQTQRPKGGLASLFGRGGS